MLTSFENSLICLLDSATSKDLNKYEPLVRLLCCRYIQQYEYSDIKAYDNLMYLYGIIAELDSSTYDEQRSIFNALADELLISPSSDVSKFRACLEISLIKSPINSIALISKKFKKRKGR